MIVVEYMGPNEKQNIEYLKESSCKIVWVASYPRSGNLLVTSILRDIFYHDTIDSVNEKVIRLDIHQPASPEKIVKIDVDGESIVLVKSHWCYYMIDDLKDITKSIIYIYRNPLDIVRSRIKFFCSNDPGIREMGIKRLYEHLSKMFEEDFSDWSRHVDDYVFGTINFPNLVLRYEDLVDNPIRHIFRLADFMGIPISDSVAGAIASNNSKAKAKERENNRPYLRNHDLGFRYVLDDTDFQYRSVFDAADFKSFEYKIMNSSAVFLQKLGYRPKLTK